MNIGDMFVRLGLEVSEFSKGIQQAQSELEKLEKSFTATGQSLSLAITAPLAALGAGSLKVFAGFESAMLKVSALAEVTGKDLEKLKEQAMQLGKDTQFSAKQAADAMGEYAAAGFSATQIYAAMPGVLDLAAAGQMAVADAAEISAGVLRGFGLAASETGRVADVLAAAAGRSAANVGDLGHSFQYVGSIASLLKVSFEEVAAALVMLGNEQVKGEQAGTAMRAMFQDLLAPSTKAQEVLGRLKISLTDASGQFRTLSDILLQFKNAGLADGPKGIADAFAIWGMRSSDVIKLVKHAGAEFDNVVAGMMKVNGAAEGMRKTLQSGLAGSWEQLTGSVETLAIKIGEVLSKSAKPIVDWIKDLADKLTDMVDRFSKLPKGIQTATMALLAFAAAIGPVILAIGMMAGAVSNLALLPGMFSSIGKAITSSAGMFQGFGNSFSSLLTMLSASNLRAVSVSVGESFKAMGVAILAGIKDLPNKMTGIKDAFLSMGPMIASAGKSIANEAKGLVLIVASEFYRLKDAITAGGGISGVLSSMGAAISSFGSTVVSSLPAAFAACRAAIMSFGASLLTIGAPIALIVAAVAALAAIGYVLYKNWEDVKAVLIGIWKDLQVAFAAFGQWFFKTVESIFGSTVAGYIKSVWNGIVAYYSAIWNGLVAVITNGLKWVLQASKAAADAVGASNTSGALGNWIAKLDGMDQGAKKAAQGVADSMRKAADAAMGTVPAITAVTTSVAGYGNAAETAKEKQDRLKKAQQEAEATTKALASALHGLRGILIDLPTSAKEFIDQFVRTKEISPELQKMGSFIDALKDKYKALGLQAAEAMEAGNAKLAAGLRGMMVTLDLAIKKQESFVNTFKAMLQIDADFSPIVKSIDEMNSALGETGVKLLTLPPLLQQIADTKWADAMKAPINEAGALAEAFKQLGISSSKSLTEAAAKAKIYYDTIANAYQQGKASANDMKAALLALTEAQIKSGDYGGAALDSLRSKSAKLRAELEASGYAIKGHGAAMRTYWQELDKQISTILNDFGKGIADAMFSAKSFGEFFSTVFENMAKTIVRFTVEYWTKIWLTDLYKGIKGLDLFGESAKKVTENLGNFVMGAAKTGGKIVETIGGAGGNTTTNAAGKAISSASTGLMGALGAISSIASAIMDVMSYFQGRRMEQDIGRIEVTSRGILNQSISIQDTLNKYLPALEQMRWLQFIDVPLSALAEVINVGVAKLVEVLEAGISVTGSVDAKSPNDPPVVDPDVASLLAKLEEDKKQLEAALAKALLAAGKAAGAVVNNTGAIDDNTGAVTDAAGTYSTVGQQVTDTMTLVSGEVSGAASDVTSAAAGLQYSTDLNSDALVQNTTGIGSLGSALGEAGAAFRAGGDTMYLAAKDLSYVWSRAANIAPGGVSLSNNSLADEIAALAKYLGVGVNAPVMSDPMWQKYYDLLRQQQQQSSTPTTPGSPAGITPIASAPGVPGLFHQPTYEQVFGDPHASVYTKGLMDLATSAMADFNASSLALPSAVSGAVASGTPGDFAVAQGNAPASVTNNFYGVTDPAVMANKIVTGMRTRGVDL